MKTFCIIYIVSMLLNLLIHARTEDEVKNITADTLIIFMPFLNTVVSLVYLVTILGTTIREISK